MLIIFRWWYFLGLGGLCCTAYGAVEMGHALANRMEPAEFSLAALEAGDRPPQPYVRLASHVALYPMTSHTERRGRIQKACYPIVSEDHPYLQAWRKLRERYGDAKVPQGEVPVLDGVRVYVFEEQWDRLTDLPTNATTNDSIEGILLPVADLGVGDRRLLTTCSGRPVDSRTLVLEAGRRPRSPLTCLQFITVGVVLLVFAVMRFFRKPAAPPG